jgi:hypothetical protein
MEPSGKRLKITVISFEAAIGLRYPIILAIVDCFHVWTCGVLNNLMSEKAAHGAAKDKDQRNCGPL